MAPWILAAALLMVGASMILFFVVVLRPRSADIPLARRRPSGAKQLSILSRFTNSAVNTVDGFMGRSGGWYSRHALYNAGVHMAPADFTVLVMATTVATGLMGGFLTNLFIGVLLAALVPLVAKLALSVLSDRRRAKFDAQLPDTVLLITGGLRAGHSILSAFDGAAQESQAPMSEELGRIVNETRLNRDLTEAVTDSATRMRNEDFGWIAQAVDINREVGGDLAEVLDQVGETIRERGHIKGQIRSLSAEGKISAYVLGALPIGVCLLLAMINPSYIGTLTQTLIGNILIGIGIFLLGLGSFWMSRVIKIKF
ncbi:type II secretion system F family protein [Arthrobacter sp. GCM10027362]|uniref:type II secretion system F family protein n=1 Tax=Arthrobacter sp. GCM10027362 TaxID=3273379 RepID=UPI00362B0FAE